MLAQEKILRSATTIVQCASFQVRDETVVREALFCFPDALSNSGNVDPGRIVSCIRIDLYRSGIDRALLEGAGSVSVER